MNEDEMIKFALICGGITLFLIIVLAASFDTVEPIEWGLKHNIITKEIDREDSNNYFDFILTYKLQSTF